MFVFFCPVTDGRTVVVAIQSGNGVDQIGMSAGEKRRELLRRRDSTLFLGTVHEELINHFDGRASEGMADQVDFFMCIGFAEIFQNTIFKCMSKADCMIFFRMGFSEIDGHTLLIFKK